MLRACTLLAFLVLNIWPAQQDAYCQQQSVGDSPPFYKRLSVGVQALPIVGISIRANLVGRFSAQIAALPAGIIDPGGNEGFAGGRLIYRISPLGAKTALFAAAGGMVELDTYRSALGTGSQSYLSATAGIGINPQKRLTLGLEAGLLHIVQHDLTPQGHPAMLPVLGLGIHYNL